MALHHRGPDASGVWVDSDSAIALGHARLSILELSPAGAQPMMSPGGRYVMVFNGEIYNHRALRAALGSTGRVVQWRGHSDTETLLACIEAWGLEKTLQCSVGMFAIALWDRVERCLYLARDRFGEKPLFYGWQGRLFIFGSELKAFHAHPQFSGEVNRDALAAYFRHNTIAAPHSIYCGVRKLTPGCQLRLDESCLEGLTPAVPAVSYWSLDAAIAEAQQDPFTGTPEEAVDALEAALSRAVSGQMMADVPLGAFLSGGVDSSTVVALMQAQSPVPVKTFTIGFHEAGYNEAEHAKAVARHLGTDHTELYVTAAEAQAVIPRLPALYDEPFSDSSQIPTLLVAELARQKVTVSLSGDAGDELFGGYARYFEADAFWRRISRIPKPLRHIFAAVIRAVPAQDWDLLTMPLRGAVPRFRAGAVGERLHRLAAVLEDVTQDTLYRQMVTHWPSPDRLVLGASELTNRLADPWAFPGITGVERMMALDAITYLPDDILTKVDRAAMGVSLETRMPMLDHRVAEFAWRLPLDLKVRAGQGKWPLRQVLYRYVPRALIDRPKMGFGVPVGAWLRGPMRDWAESLLAVDRLRNDGFLNVTMVRRKWDEHLSGRCDWQYHLWDVLMFQQWLDTYVGRS